MDRLRTHDFQRSTNQTLKFEPGEVVKTIRVGLVHDSTVEDLETFRINLSAASGGTFAKASGTAVIGDDDGRSASPNITIEDVIVDESRDASVVIRLNSASNGIVRVTYATANGAPRPAPTMPPGSGTLTFLPGETAKTVRLDSVDDAAREGMEQIHVNLSNAVGAQIGTARGTVTIADNDGARSVNPLISIDNVWMNESDAYARFTVSLSAPSNSAVSVTWGTQGDTANSNDFVGASSQTLTFPPARR